MKPRIAIMASGRGSNALNLESFLKSRCEIAGLISDKKDAPVVEKFKGLDHQALEVLQNKDLPREERRAEQEGRILSILKSWEVDWVLLAGFMKILSKEFIQKFCLSGEKNSRIINIHPSLLPQFPGLHAYERGFDSENSYHGVTVHYVNEEVDAGEIIYQERYQKNTGESFEHFSQRGLELEHKIYPLALEKILFGDYHE